MNHVGMKYRINTFSGRVITCIFLYLDMRSVLIQHQKHKGRALQKYYRQWFSKYEKNLRHEFTLIRKMYQMASLMRI